MARRALIGLAAAAVASAALATPAMAAFPGTNGKIAFSRDDHQIVTKTPGSVVSDPPLASGAQGHGAQNRDPAWSPEGSRIAFVSDRDELGGSLEVYTMNSNGSAQTRVTFELGSAANPAWSPDGTRIAFDVGDDTDRDVVVMNANGTGRLVVAGGMGLQELPVWTPDGARIVFQDSTVSGLSSVGSTGAGRAPFLGDAFQPDFSPDGSRLAVRRGDGRIHIVNADGSGGFPITPGQGVRPAWSPDGTRIVYNRFVNSTNREDLFTIGTSPGSPEVPETSTAELDVAPDWQPIPIPRAAPPTTGPGPPPAAGPGGLALSSARFAPKWKVSKVGGSLVVAGAVVRAARLQAQVLRASGRGKALLTRGFRLAAAGPFTRRLALAGARLLPGPYLVRVRDVGTGPKLPAAQLLARLGAPPEGVVSRAGIGTALGGRARATIARGPSIIFASFRFAALPAKGRRLTVTWYSSERPGPIFSDPKPRTPRVNAFLKARVPLPAARYRAELRAGKALVAVARARVR